MSTRPVGSRLAGTRQRPWLGAWVLIVLFLNAACATGVSRGGMLVGFHYRPLTPRFHEDARPSTAEAEEGEAADERVHLFLPTRFGAVQVSDFELNDALATLVLNMPLRVADSHFPLYLHRKLALASASLTSEEWRTPLARSYGSFCERQGTPGDCLGLFKDGPGLDGEDKRDLALALSVNVALESRDAELRGMFSTTQLWTTLSLTIIGYLALVAAPEPVSKCVAGALALLMWGYLGWELFDLVRAWFKLWEEAAEASTFAELREAGDRFGKVIGPNSVRILLLLGTAAVGETAALVSKAPKLPGFAKAAGALESHAGIRDVLTAAQEADKVKVAVAEGTFSVVLPANVVSMAARGSPARVGPPKKKPEVHHIATVENEKSTLRGGPWTKRFKPIFDKAGMSMEDPANKVQLPGHYGPHPEEYHQAVFDDLDMATKDSVTQQECARALRKVLGELAAEITRKGSRLNRLLTE
ncbi:AHH domain-containing protein [Archangium violaceum]|uniref:AHH domain-containing protein n=1 Tax=Archangium violaceum TaxID=83451 RepID=UPI001952199E|nr:AHH domain-containing protein [Archangium violaceum]QRN94042.1 AHH domain-containing protein [Archangium violaceum]